MAVVQISKIQVRRGRKLGETGIPQLSSGEMAWAVDSQELYIGNGAVAEGAPYVGNTKVLTEHDNLLELIESYRYGRNEPSITQSVFRTLQEKLDDRVNVKDFGATGNGTTDDTEAFQNALDQLYRNTSTEFRKQLYVPTGHYRIAGILRIPSYAILDGESQVGTVLLVNSSTIELQSSNGTQNTAFESTDRPTDILVRNLTFRFTTGTIDLTGIKDSIFEAVTFQGPLTNLSLAAAASSGTAMVTLENTDKIGTVISNLEFEGCKFEQAYRAVNFTQTDPYVSNVNFSKCKFYVLNGAVEINGIINQVNDWLIDTCEFEQIVNRAFTSDFGTGVRVKTSKFTDCGNNVNLASNPEQSIIVFEQAGNNTVVDCSFNRHKNAYTDPIIGDERMTHPEVLNSGNVVISDETSQLLYNQATPTPLAMFSTLNRKTILNYVVSFNTGISRTGTLTITVGDNLINPSISDSYMVSQDDTPYHSTVSPSESLEFSVELVDRNDSTAGSETMILKYKNPSLSGSHSMAYYVSYGV